MYSIGYKDKYNDFNKLCDKKGRTMKFTTIQECKEFIKNDLRSNIYKIMKGWEVIEILEKVSLSSKCTFL